ncbi:N2227-like protein-domain-containing protein [Naematelia encephala]|uniref:carnosine N-methyltransferase n=1 Tax=Naematelia encephala TaxID=71784 RepID=A0A1Y2BM86_9TREE|nr:N2227-like protein-domain-containing protein [Naematelia encephala]
MADTPEERAHWRSVLRAFDGYMQYHLSANHARRMAFLQLPKEAKQMYEAIGYREKLEAVDEGIRRNAEFIDELIADPVFADMLSEPIASDAHSHDHHHHDHTDNSSHSHSHSHSHSAPRPQSNGEKKLSQAELDLAQDKVRSTLRSFVRDWSDEGAAERQACYDPCLEALEAHWESKGRDKRDVEVLVPGCGLGRLAMEIAAKGFSSQGNEFSTYMLLASHFVLNQTSEAKSYSIHPYVHSFSNQPTTGEHLLRRVDIPDICPSDVLGDGKGGPFSLVAGDFEEIYGEANWDHGDGRDGTRVAQRRRWGAVVTCFFIDCARNVLTFLNIIHTILEDDGIWINIGPLLWHFENSPTPSAKGEGSIELSLDEVKDLARLVGFEIHQERTISTTYTGIPGAMLKHEYQAAFWTATKI